MRRLDRALFVGIACLLFWGVGAPAQADRASDRQTAVRWVLEGGRLEKEAAMTLENSLRSKPDHLENRTRLLGYYSRQRTESGRDARLRHVLWLIANRPDAAIAGMPPAEIDPLVHPEGYKKARSAWVEQVKKSGEDIEVLGNAASFFMRADGRQAEQLLLRAEKLDDENPYWSRQLAQLYRLQYQAGNTAAAVQAFASMRKAYDKTDNETAKLIMLAGLAQSAFAAKDYRQARTYADQALEGAEKLKESWAYGEALHHGNLVLGRLAVTTGDLNAAKRLLIEAAKTPGSPTLNSFGPNMSLARDLVEKGERDAVLAYFKMCGKFWPGGKRKLERWSEQVRRGEVPDFGANLHY